MDAKLVTAVKSGPNEYCLGLLSYDYGVGKETGRRVLRMAMTPANQAKLTAALKGQWWTPSLGHDLRNFTDTLTETQLIPIDAMLEARSYLAKACIETWAVQLQADVSSYKDSTPEAFVSSFLTAVGDLLRDVIQGYVGGAAAVKAVRPQFGNLPLAPVTRQFEAVLNAFRPPAGTPVVRNDYKDALGRLGGFKSDIVKACVKGILTGTERMTYDLDGDQRLEFKKAGLSVATTPGVYPEQGRTLVEFDFSRMYPTILVLSGLTPAGFGPLAMDTYASLVEHGVDAKNFPDRSRQSSWCKLGSNAWIGKQEATDPNLFKFVTAVAQGIMADLLTEVVAVAPYAKILQCATDGAIVSCLPGEITAIQELLAVEIATSEGYALELKCDIAYPAKLALRDNNSYVSKYPPVDGNVEYKRKGAFRAETSRSARHRPKPTIVARMAADALLNGVDPAVSCKAYADVRHFVLPLLDCEIGIRREDAEHVTAGYAIADTASRKVTWRNGNRYLTHAATDKQARVSQVVDLTRAGAVRVSTDYAYYVAEADALIKSVLPSQKGLF